MNIVDLIDCKNEIVDILLNYNFEFNLTLLSLNQ